MEAWFWGLRAFALIVGISLGASAQAATIYGVTGPSPFGFANQNPVAIGWSQATEYRNVSISIPLADLVAGGPIGGAEGTIYLMNRVGPGTTTANEVAAPPPTKSPPPCRSAG